VTDNFAALQQRLILGYQAQLQHYDRAIRIVAQPTPGADQGATCLHDLNAVLREISALDAALAEDKAVWRSSGYRPGPPLRDILDRVTARIRELSAIIDRRVAVLEARKQALLPEVDECIQQRRMLHAYGKSR
jgi:hypothetical protein